MSPGLEQRAVDLGAARWPFLFWSALIALAAVTLSCGLVPIGPEWSRVAASIVVATGFTWGLAARTGGRPVVFAVLTLVCTLAAVISDNDVLVTGAAIGTAVLASVLGVMTTVPTKGYLGSIRECVIALLHAGLGAMAAIGFGPAIDEERFEYAVLGLAFISVIVLVFRLGAGFHGLGRRGLVIVAIGAALAAATLLYAELLRRYGSTGLVDDLLSLVRWCRDHIGAFPRPVATVLGVPALAYGCHMRARRRQGWWVCAFGVAATAPAASALANPLVAVPEAALSVLYSLLVGLVVGWILVRLDLAMTGNGGRRSRVAEQEAAVRPEPSRFQPLL